MLFKAERVKQIMLDYGVGYVAGMAQMRKSAAAYGSSVANSFALRTDGYSGMCCIENGLSHSVPVVVSKSCQLEECGIKINLSGDFLNSSGYRCI